MTEPIDGVSRSGIQYRRGAGPALMGGLTVAWDILACCPSCGAATGENCTINWPGKPTKRVTPCRERLPELNVVGDALEPDKAAPEDATARTTPSEGDGTGSGPGEAYGAAEGAMDSAIEAAATATESHHIDFDQSDADGYNPCICGQWSDGEGPGWDEHMADIGLRAAEPYPRQAVAEDIRIALLTGLDGLQRHGQFKLIDPEDVAELVVRVALEVGRP